MLPDPFDRLLGESAQARAMRAFGRRAASVSATVLLTGETGTGKGILARAIHDASTRSRAPFVAVNCAGVPESLFESEFFGHVRGAFTGALSSRRGLLLQADRGTLFLDEVGELSLGLQAKLLTALEDGELRPVGAERVARFDARLIAATGVDLESAMHAQRFRADLYHRLCILRFHLPPLRSRRDDIPILTRHFAALYSQRYQCRLDPLPDTTIALLKSYAWPGNVRELAHTIEGAVIAAENGTLKLDRLENPALRIIAIPSGPGHRLGRYAFAGSAADERQLILETLEKCGGNKTLTAKQLGMSRNTLISRLKCITASLIPDP
jgi:two-component system, NtrC family, response regulator AtoC